MRSLFKPAVFSTFLVLTACGGGGGGDGGSAAISLSGTAASGASMPLAEITLKDPTGKTLTATADANGNFTVTDVSSLGVPFMLKAVGLVDGQETSLFSVLEEKPSGTQAVANITPMTNAVVTQLASGDADALFAAPTGMSTSITKAKMTEATESIVEAVKDVATQLGITGTIDPFKMKFSADNTGLDKLLDLVKFQPDASGTVSIQNKAGGAPIEIPKGTTKAQIVSQNKKMPQVETALINLDVSPMKTIVANLNTALKTKSSPALAAAFGEAMDDTFLLNGMNKSTFIDKAAPDLVKADSAEFLNFALGACSSDGSVCEGSLILKSDGVIEPLDGAIKKTGGVWKFWGNQAPIDVSVNQVMQVTFNTANSPPVVETGINISMSSGSVLADGQYTSAKVYFGYKSANNAFEYISDESGPVSAAIFELKQLNGCGYLVPTKKADGSLNTDVCGNFISTPSGNNAYLEAVNAKIVDGTFRLKIVANNDSNLAYTFNPKFNKQDNSEISKITAALVASIKMDEFAKREITLLNNIEHASLRFSYGNIVGDAKFSMSGEDNQSIKKVGSAIDMKEACEKYKADNSATSLDCASANTSGVITHYFQLLRVPNKPNTKVWVSVNRPS